MQGVTPIGLLAVALATIAASLPAEGQQRPARPLPRIDVAVEDAADVWSRADGTGYANDIVRAAFRAGGYEPVYHVMPYARCKAVVTRAQMPVCVSMSRDPSIKPWIAFADSANFTFNSDFYHATARPLPRSASRLRRGTLVGAVLGYEYPDTVYRLERRGVIRLEYAKSETINLRKLADGRLDAALVNTDSNKRADDLLARAGVEGRVSLAFKGGTLPGYVGFNLRHPLGAELRARYNAGRRAIAANGELVMIKSRWADTIRAISRAAPAPARRPPP